MTDKIKEATLQEMSDIGQEIEMNIKELAEQAGLAYKTKDGHYWIDAGYVDIHLERFAELVATAEREACAKVCEPQEEHDDPLTAYNIAQLIRARGDKHD